MDRSKISPDRIETIQIADLKPYERNARRHPSWQLDQIAASIRKFGFTVPILITPDRTIVAGHGRVEAARTIGLESIKAITISPEWTRDDIAAYVLADNQIALNAEWDFGLLKLEIEQLQINNFDLSVLGFNDAELARVLNPNAPDVDPQKAWEGMPEFSHEDKTAFKTIYVHFHDQESINSFSGLVGQNITDKTKFIWFPDKEIEHYIDKEYS